MKLFNEINGLDEKVVGIPITIVILSVIVIRFQWLRKYSIKEQYSIIKTDILRDNSSKRIDCPFCWEHKTLSLSKMQETLFRNCYKASCGAKGIKDDKLSINSIKSRLNSTWYKSRRSNPNQIPTLLSNFEHHPTSLDYLESVQCLDVYKSNSIHIKYTPSDQRVLFFMNDNIGLCR